MNISYVYMNIILMGLGIWSIAHHESPDSVLMFLLCHIFSILQDIILLGLYEPRGYDTYEVPGVQATARNQYRFSLGMSILNLIIKPVTAFLLFTIYKQRGGSYSDLHLPNSIPGFGGHHSSAYEDIDTPGAPSNSNMDRQGSPQHYSDTEKH